MSKTVTSRLKDDVYNAFMEAAVAENRSLSNLIETASIRAPEIVSVQGHAGLYFRRKKVRTVIQNQIQLIAVAVTIKMKTAAVTAMQSELQRLHHHQVLKGENELDTGQPSH